jgi:hypothetical protein
MPSVSAASGPVAIGGVGGSGTRVIAAIVESLGFDPGANLNRPRDDLTFTVLFKRPGRYPGVRGLIPADHPAAVAAVRVFASVRTGGHRPLGDVVPMLRASVSLPSHTTGTGLTGVAADMNRRIRRLRRLPTVFRHRPPDAGPWMWKEPNTLFFLPTLYGQIPGLRYIHVVRNGLSMATSSNNYQLTNWSYLFDVGRAGRDDVRQLVYWARANLAVTDFLGDRPEALVVSHERTVTAPDAVADEISSFLGVPRTGRTRRVIDGVRAPSDFGRTFEVPDDEVSHAELADIRRALDRFGYGGDPGAIQG